MCHDDSLESRDPAWPGTVAEERASNPMVGEGISEEAFVAIRERRDATLGAPPPILPALQDNICAGCLPPRLPMASAISRFPSMYWVADTPSAENARGRWLDLDQCPAGPHSAW